MFQSEQENSKLIQVNSRVRKKIQSKKKKKAAFPGSTGSKRESILLSWHVKAKNRLRKSNPVLKIEPCRQM